MANSPDGFVTLIAPPGAQDAPVSFGATGYQCFPETPGDPRSRWLVRVPAYTVQHFLGVGGFVVLPD
jgi:hypothetical protein